MTLSPFKPRRRPGFTLVEMLTVIVIIGILAGLTVGGAIAARNAVRRGIVIADMKQMEMGLQKYKGEVGEFPPDFAFCDELAGDRGKAARARVVSHLRKAFPKMRLSGTTTDDQFLAFLTTSGMAVGQGDKELNPSTALTFWLGGMCDADGKPKGFSQDPTNPFKRDSVGKLTEPRTTPYYDFDTERMKKNKSDPPTLQLMQPKIQPATPYVYFRAVKNNVTGYFEYGDADGNGVFAPFTYGSGTNVCVPYLENAYDKTPVLLKNPDPKLPARKWRTPETYQIVAAGLDGTFSTYDSPVVLNDPRNFRFSLIGEKLTDGDYDNLASFAEGELENEL